jgi:hypothetical protein
MNARPATVVVKAVPSLDSLSRSPDRVWLMVRNGSAEASVRLSAARPPGTSAPVLLRTQRSALPHAFLALASPLEPRRQADRSRRRSDGMDRTVAIHAMASRGGHVKSVPKAGPGWDPVWRPQ